MVFECFMHVFEQEKKLAEEDEALIKATFFHVSKWVSLPLVAYNSNLKSEYHLLINWL